ncbi:MAG: glycosyltransferase [Candidatus Magasanikbacteria bacterium]
MKLYYVANVRVPTEKAHGYQISKMCESLVRAGADVTLVIPQRRNFIDESLFKFYGIEENLFKIKRIPTIDLTFIQKKIFYRILSFSFACFSFLYFLFKRGNVSIYCRGESVLWLAMLPKRFCVFWESHIKPGRLDLYQKPVSRLRGVVCVTSYYQKEIIEIFDISKENVLLFPDAVDIEAFNIQKEQDVARKLLGIPQDKWIVMYVGSDLKWKGVDVLKGAANLLPANFLVIFVGNISSEGDGKGYYVGQKNQKEIPLWLKASDCLVLTGNSESSVSRNYTSPLKMFEYMASKRPIVSFRIPSFGDILGSGNSLVLKNNTPEDLASNLLHLEENPSVASKIVDQAFLDVQAYTWDKRAVTVLSFLNKRI